VNIITVYPLGGAGYRDPSGLTYFIKQDVVPGSIVEVKLGKKLYPAFVASVENISHNKQSLKNSSYALKKIQRTISKEPPYHPSLIGISQTIANFYRESPGSVLKLFMPAALLESPLSFTPHWLISASPLTYNQFDVVVGSIHERIDFYDSLVREAYAKQKRVVIFTPTKSIVLYLHTILSRFRIKPMMLHGGLSKKQLKKSIEEYHAQPAPSLLVATPLALGILRGDEDSIVVEDADSAHYQKKQRPLVNLVGAIRSFAHENHTHYYECKYTPSLRDLMNDIKPNYLSSRQKQIAPFALADMTLCKEETLSPDALQALRTLTGKALIFTTRKGFYTFIYCTDCHKLALCSACRGPLVLYSFKKTYYKCRKCGAEYDPHMQCEDCGGWNLRGYGIGSQRIYGELKKKVPERPCWILDDTTASTPLKRKAILEAFNMSTDGILVGTEMILEEPSLSAEIGIVANCDNLFSLPEFNINERVLSLLLRFSEKISNTPTLIQTRFVRHPLFQRMIKQEIKQLLLGELEERKAANFPPYVLFIKITIAHADSAEREKRAAEAHALLKPHVLDISSFDSFADKSKHHILVTISRDSWRNGAQTLKEILDAHLREWDVVVDPENVLV